MSKHKEFWWFKSAELDDISRALYPSLMAWSAAWFGEDAAIVRVLNHFGDGAGERGLVIESSENSIFFIAPLSSEQLASRLLLVHEGGVSAAESFVEFLLSQLSSSLLSVLPGCAADPDVTVSDGEGIPEFAVGDGFVAVVFTVRESEFTLILPPFIARALAGIDTVARPSTVPPSVRLKDCVGGSRVSFVVTLGHVELPLSALGSLAPGDVIRLHRPASPEVLLESSEANVLIRATVACGGDGIVAVAHEVRPN